ncbi:MAG: hypothetical protein ACLP01_30100, partial [Solirubrobacteraceae bacterium]
DHHLSDDDVDHDHDAHHDVDHDHDADHHDNLVDHDDHDVVERVGPDARCDVGLRRLWTGLGHAVLTRAAMGHLR